MLRRIKIQIHYTCISLIQLTPEMFRNNNFVNKDGQKISFGRIHQKRWPGGIKHLFPLHKGDMKFAHPRNSHISLGRCPREI